jgi:hypothetical protein
MPAVQTTYPSAMPKGFPGMIADQYPYKTISRNVSEAGGIAFGAPVVRGANDRDAIQPNANGENKFLGIACRDPSEPLAAVGSEDKYNQYSEAMILTQGIIWVTVAGNVTAGNPVYVTEATGGYDDASGSNIFQIPGAVWEDTATTGNLARIRIY